MPGRPTEDPPSPEIAIPWGLFTSSAMIFTDAPPRSMLEKLVWEERPKASRRGAAAAAKSWAREASNTWSPKPAGILRKTLTWLLFNGLVSEMQYNYHYTGFF